MTLISLQGALGLPTIDYLQAVLEPVDGAGPPDDLSLDFSEVEDVAPAGVAVLGARLRTWRRESGCDPTARYRPPSAGRLGMWLGRPAIDAMLAHCPHGDEDGLTVRGCEAFSDMNGAYRAAQRLRLALVHHIALEARAIESVGTMIDEICRNVIQHGDPAGGVAAVAPLPDGRFELAVADVGIGIHASLAQNPDYAHIDDPQALQTALEPGATGEPGRGRGMGLFLTRLVIAENGGTLILRSGSAQVIASPGTILSTPAPWLPGTLVIARVRPNAPFDYGHVDEALSRAGGVRA